MRNRGDDPQLGRISKDFVMGPAHEMAPSSGACPKILLQGLPSEFVWLEAQFIAPGSSVTMMITIDWFALFRFDSKVIRYHTDSVETIETLSVLHTETLLQYTHYEHCRNTLL